MIGCDNDACAIEWFHLDCVNLKVAPTGKWFCPDCTRAKWGRGTPGGGGGAAAARKH